MRRIEMKCILKGAREKRCKIFVGACIIFIFLIPLNSSAKSLAQSFSGGSDYEVTRVRLNGDDYKKTAWAQTSGYYNYSKRHYVRAYIGGNSSSAQKAIADTGRQYSYGNIYAKCRTANSVYVPKGDSVYARYFPTAYAKYGSN